MSQFLALASAAFYGMGDFTGGLATKRLPIWTVMMWSQLAGLFLLAVGLLVVPAESVTATDVLFGGLAGLAGFLGLVILYQALAGGTMSVVAPITGATGAAIPVIVDVVGGSPLSNMDWIGIGLAIGAVVLLGLELTVKGLSARTFLLAIVAGAAFAAFFIAFAQADEASGLWPVAASRGASVPVAILIAWRFGAARRPDRGDVGLVASVGLLDMAANLLILLSLQRGSLAVTSVLSSLYPAVTVLAAVVFLHERPSATQQSGIGLALLAVVALAS